ncbi:hypothetical protein K7I13_09205 [Brucepastera parasyntrophica]|uniref:hypothetical protein n=1 Tax=Brucepastera parasyntrophica TaxID=2880008 RepID=UPI00210A350A|nr:hypothetical protein [Brucepastera parasyntrophica]ULQ58729.1 hypothetical protein K7I13_09205 [Brucepastera parasyntrophica]
MTRSGWTYFVNFRDSFQAQCETWKKEAVCGKDNWLGRLQKQAAEADKTPAYPLETSIVYNRSLDDVTQNDLIKLILVGDNPGKNEQLAGNNRYLVGQAGKLGEGFFRKNPELGIDFRKNVIILNKTPIHTAKTKQLALLCKNGGDRFNKLFEESQKWMAEQTALLQQKLKCSLWLVGYGELRKSGLFSLYAETLKKEYEKKRKLSDADVYLYQHFSMNRFSIDLKSHYNGSITLAENLRSIGLMHRKEVIGW